MTKTKIKLQKCSFISIKKHSIGESLSKDIKNVALGATYTIHRYGLIHITRPEYGQFGGELIPCSRPRVICSFNDYDKRQHQITGKLLLTAGRMESAFDNKRQKRISLKA